MRIDRKKRLSLKKAAIANLRGHYALFLVMCVFASFVGAEFVTSENFIATRTTPVERLVSGYQDEIIETEHRVESFTGASALSDKIKGILDGIKLDDEKSNEIFSRSTGTLNQVIDCFVEGTIVSTISSVVLNIVGSESAYDIVMISLSLFVAALFYIFIQAVFVATMRRIALEGRVYSKVPIYRFVFFLRNKTWINAGLVMGLSDILVLLSLGTVVAFPFVYYGLLMVPYILAENPKVKPLDAVKLSWRMTKGHKLDLFVTDVSLVGWFILGLLTLGLTDIFFANPYRISVYSEIFVYLRKEAIDNGVKGKELFCDRYLYEKCDPSKLRKAYNDTIDILSEPEYQLESLTGSRKFFAEHFGVVLWNTEDEGKYEENQARRQSIKYLKQEVEGDSYPRRFAPVPEVKKRGKLGSFHYMRHYSVLSLVLMFFIYSGFGWVWEVIYYYMLQGHYINRGVLHGPWLPIYGAGGLAILIFLFPLRKSPGKHFVATMILCGAMEYITSVILEYVFHAQWWSYKGFFLNLNGRICAEGVLVFGVAGFAFIYFLSPALDDIIRKFNPMKLIPVAAVLLVFFAFDIIYSRLHPNMGSGITDNFAGLENVETEPQSESTAETFVQIP